MKKILISLVIALVIISAFFLFGSPKTSGFTAIDSYKGDVDYYKSGSCGCCEIHANYLYSKGKMEVNKINLEDLSTIKEKYGIPSQLESCHTAIIDGYIVEGHIPLEAINKLLEERPDIKGIAMPGMPSGSPGMPGPKTSDFVIYQINNDGSYEEFMRL